MALAMSAVPELSLSGTKLARVRNFDDQLGLRERLGGGVDNERNFLYLLNAVAAREEKGGQRRRE